MNSKLLKLLIVTAELCGTAISETAGKLLLDDLESYPEAQVEGALKKCRRELQGRLTLPAILTRLDDGRPGPDEAWAMIPKDESDSAVLTQETLTAWGIVSDLHCDDRQGARFAFREAYARLIAEARAKKREVQWVPSMGSDASGRVAALEDAVRAGRLLESQAIAICPTEHLRSLQIALAVEKLSKNIDRQRSSPRVQALIDEALEGKVTRKDAPKAQIDSV